MTVRVAIHVADDVIEPIALPFGVEGRIGCCTQMQPGLGASGAHSDQETVSCETYGQLLAVWVAQASMVSTSLRR
jgi:hypothetical protein